MKNSDIRNITVLEFDYEITPPEVQKEIRNLWQDFELGNDHYIHKWCPEYLDEGDYPEIHKYLHDQGVADKEVWIHWWW